MIERLALHKPELQIRNPNFRGQQPPQFRIKQREQRAQDTTSQQQQVKTPVQQNFVGLESDDEDNVVGEENHFFTPDDMPTFITEDDEKIASSAIQHDADFILANDISLEEEQDEGNSGDERGFSGNL